MGKGGSRIFLPALQRKNNRKDSESSVCTASVAEKSQGSCLISEIAASSFKTRKSSVNNARCARWNRKRDRLTLHSLSRSPASLDSPLFVSRFFSSFLALDPSSPIASKAFEEISIFRFAALKVITKIGEIVQPPAAETMM